jgi:hypothetical protein
MRISSDFVRENSVNVLLKVLDFLLFGRDPQNWRFDYGHLAIIPYVGRQEKREQ